MRNCILNQLAIISIAILSFIQYAESDVMPKSTGSVFALDIHQIQTYSEQAKHGDKEAAFKLYQHYTLSMYDENLSSQWLLEAAKLGHSIAQYNLAVHYEEIGDKKSAELWGKKAYENGNVKAKRFIQ